jgi:hypothetical protein
MANGIINPSEIFSKLLMFIIAGKLAGKGKAETGDTRLHS